MKIKLSQWIFLISTLLFISGCAGTGTGSWNAGAPLPEMTADKVSEPGMYSAKVDTFHILLDASSSMDQVPGIYRKYDLAVNILDRMNQMLPEYNMAGGLRSFGHHPELTGDDTRPFYGIAPYNTAAFGQSLYKIKPAGGTSPLEKAFNSAAEDLGDNPGKIALIVVSDGKDMDPAVLPAARRLADRYGRSICFYPIFIGDDEMGRLLMEDIADLNSCGFVTPGRDLTGNNSLKEFVHKVFLDKSAVVTTVAKATVPKVTDSDGDGVIDKWDHCPDTPAGSAVDSNGCEAKSELADSDGDGIYDIKDKCPGTPEGAKVGLNGCWNVGNIFFGFDEYRIRPKGEFELMKVKNILDKNPDLRIKLQGHTCDIGTRAYNLNLSKQRADAVKAFLIDHGISPGRLETEGVGFSMPLVPNTSAENRAMNRRTEIHPID